MAALKAKKLYRLRSRTVELGFADFQQHRAMRQFSGRGFPAAAETVLNGKSA